MYQAGFDAYKTPRCLVFSRCVSFFVRGTKQVILSLVTCGNVKNYDKARVPNINKPPLIGNQRYDSISALHESLHEGDERSYTVYNKSQVFF